MTTTTITTEIVTNADGSINSKESRAAFSAQLKALVGEQGAVVDGDDSEVAAAVNAVFDSYPGVRLNMQALTSYAAASLGATPATLALLTERVENFVRANSSGKINKTTGLAANPDSLFISNFGPKACLQRRSDVEAAAEAAADGQTS